MKSKEYDDRPMPRALLSVSDKRGLTSLARALIVRGYELISTGGTAKSLEADGIRAIEISRVTGFPEIMEGRVKTLHPAVHSGILARRHRPEDIAELRRHRFSPIDLVVVNLYPFTEAATRRDVTLEQLLEQIDIGGPTLVRAAAKNFQDVLVVVSPDDYETLLTELDRSEGPSPAFRTSLAQKAFAHTSTYDAAIAQATARIEWTDKTIRLAPAAERDTANEAAGFPEKIDLDLHKIVDLRYGENPHQRAAWYSTHRAATELGGVRQWQGKELSYTNLLDLNAAWRVVTSFDEPAAVVVKHANPCGVAVGHLIEEAYVRARDADALSAFGGVIGLNRELSGAAAHAIVSTFIEAVIAPAIASEARAILARKAGLRVLTYNPARSSGVSLEVRSVLGGYLIQERDDDEPVRPDTGGGHRVATRRSPTPAERHALDFAWRVCPHVKSNAIVFALQDRTLGIGAGQMSRVDAVKVATMKMKEAGGGAEPAREGLVAASDGFFPFRDGVDAIAEAGATAIIQPGGSKRDEEVIAAADEHGLAMILTGQRRFRH